MNQKDRNLKFSEDLQSFLIKELGEESEEVCRYAACSLIHESIEVCYQNAPNKKDFEKVYKAMVNRIFEMWNELLRDENEC